ncbi:MAG: SRPBCC domain-containing protein, partial [Usitatibacteraceae bacterium]
MMNVFGQSNEDTMAALADGWNENTEAKVETMSKLTVKADGDRHIGVVRRFAASPEAVYRAHVEPKLIQRWLVGSDDWSMPVCICEARPGGKIRYEWSDGKGGGFYQTGEFIAL